MRKIDNITQLRQEYARLSAMKIEQEELLKRDMADIVESLKPVNILFSLSRDLFAKKNDKILLQTGLNIGLQLLTSKLLAGGKVGIVKTILTYLGQNVASNLISSKAPSIMDRIKGMFSFGKKKSDEQTSVTDDQEKHYKYN